MRIISIENFNGGMAEDYQKGRLGEFSISKHFDILGYPQRLQPLRGMAAESTTNSLIGNMMVASNGLLYGVGTDPANPTLGRLWVRSDNDTTANGASYGASATWRGLTNNQLSGVVLRTADYALLVEYPDVGTPVSTLRTIFWASTNLIISSNPLGTNSAATQALTFATISQGFVHPRDKILYIGYQTTNGVDSRTYIAQNNAGTWNLTALELPSNYRVYSLTSWGNYLAIGCASTSSGANPMSSVVFLWDRDTSNTTVNEVIPWTAGFLKVLNNLGGRLVGVSVIGDTAAQAGTSQDYNAIQIKTWNGGAEPTLVKEIIATRLTSTAPSITINENVNFIYNNRLYFSVNIVNGGTAPAYYGLWSLGLNKSNRYVLTIERVATNANTETGVLAAAIVGDFVAMAHTAVGTLTYTLNSNALASIYAATSIYESCINPGMDEYDRQKDKKLMSVFCSYLPLPTAAQVVMAYRVDASLDGSWTTIFTETGNSVVKTEMVKPASGHFLDGKNYEFRLESTNGAIITSFGYKYEVKSSNI